MSPSSHAANAATPAAITEKTRLAFAARSLHQMAKFISASVRHAPLPMDQMTVTQLITGVRPDLEAAAPPVGPIARHPPLLQERPHLRVGV